MKKILVLAFMFLCIGVNANAEIKPWLIPLVNPINNEWKNFISEAGAMTAYRGVAPATSLGTTGFSLGVAINFIEIDTDYWNAAIKGVENDWVWKWKQILNGDIEYDPKIKAVYTFSLRKGLPYGFDVAVSYTRVPNSDIYLVGGELQYQVIKDTEKTPAIAIRAGFSRMYGIDDIEVKVYSVDIVGSKTFGSVNPYLGLGVFKTEGKYTGDEEFFQTTFKDESNKEFRGFVGLEVAPFEYFRLTIEAEYNNQTPIYSTKFSVGW